MSGVERVGAGRPVIGKARTGTVTVSAFFVPEDAFRSAGVASPAAPAVGPLPEPRERAPGSTGDLAVREQAGALLSELAQLQRSMLSGGDMGATLARLDGVLSTAAPSGSPGPEALLAAIRTRARVELARRQGGRADNPFIAGV